MRHTDGLTMKPSLEDYKKLVTAYQTLGRAYEEQESVLNQQNEQIAIKNSAIQQQTEDIKRLDSEIMWTRAALEQAQQVAEESKQSAAAAENESWQEKYMRLKAETDNMRKRWEQRSIDQAHEGRNRVLTDMLPLADHLEMALKHASLDPDETGEGEPPKKAKAAAKKKTKKKAEASNGDAFVDNIRATFAAFLATLKRYNVEPINALGQPFDPNLHEAIGRMPSEDVPSDHVAQVMQTGYVDGEKLLRPARVLVSE